MLRYFTLLAKDQISGLEQEHAAAPHERAMQKALAKEMTILVHSSDDYKMALEASGILFGKGTTDTLRRLPEKDFLSVFDGVPRSRFRDELLRGISIIDLVSEKTGLFPSKSEARRMLSQGGVSINKSKITDPNTKTGISDLLNDKYILLQKGKKSYFLVEAVG